MISFKSAAAAPSVRQSYLQTLLHARGSRLVLAALVAFITLTIFIWQGSAAAGSDTSTLSRVSAQWGAKLRAALNVVLPAQGGIGGRTVITTIAGGGFSTNAPVRQAPMVLPTAVARDPLGRGFYVVDEDNGTSLLRFVNTTSAPVTLAGTTILPGQINLIAGGGTVVDTPSVREVDLTLITGLVVDPTGNVVYLTTPLVSSLRAVNVGTEDFRIFNQTIAPGTTKVVYQISRSDFRAITMNAAREFFYIGVTPTGGMRVVYKLEAAGNNGNGLETIYAGGGTPQFGNGDGGPATQAKLTVPMGLALDSQGNLFIAEGGDTRGNPGAVRRVDTNGVIDSVAANLEFPTGIAVGPTGSVYVALGNAQQILRVTGGARTLVAGSSTIAACDPQNNPTCGDGGPATQAFLNLPGSTQVRSLTLAADANGVYLPDFIFRRVRYINTSGAPVNIAGTTIGGGQINTIVGSGQERPYDNVPAINSELSAPTGVAEDANGNIFFTDTGADPVSRLRFINRGATPVTLFAGTPIEKTVQPGHIVTLNNQAGELASDDRITTAVFAAPQGVAVTAQGVYIVDSQYGALVRPAGSLNGRRSGHVRFLNTSNQDVIIFPNGGGSRVVVPPGQIRDIVGRNDSPGAGADFAADAPANQAILFPTDVLVDAQNNLFIADQGNNRIRRVNGSTGFVTSVQTTSSDGLTPLVTGGATGIALGAGGRLHIADTRNDRVLRQDAAGSNTFTVIANNTRGINRPRDLTVDAAGNVFVTNAGTEQILRIQAPTNALGTTSIVAGTGQTGITGDGGPAILAKLNLPNPGTSINDVQVMAGIIRLANGDLLFTDTDNNRLRLLVQQPNQAPVLAATNDVTLDEGQTQTVTINATDGNGDPLTITVTGAPAFATFNDQGNGTATLQLAPGFSDAGQYTVNVAVTDGDAGDAKSFTITVRDANRPPTVNVTPLNPTYEATGPNGRTVNLAATASDPDGDALNVQWFDGATQIATALTAQVTLGIGNHSIFLTVTDSKGAATSSPAMAVVVQDTTPPVINNVPAEIVVQATADEGATVNYTMPTATDIVDGNVTVTTSKPSGSVFPVGTTTVNFTATDARGNAATASFIVTVTPRGSTGGGGSYTISTYAGNGDSGASGNGGPATAATFRQINGLGFNSNGLLIVDGQSRMVRLVDAQERINSFAGNGANANSGDNGPAIFASFGQPGGVAADAQGNVYISDINFNRVRRVAADGRIFHFAGSSTGQSGAIGDNGQATNARLNRPTALAVDAQGNVYVCDTGNNRVRMINVTTGIITTVAGNGGAGFESDGVRAHFTSLNNPTGVALDAQGNIYIADRNNQRVRKVDAVSRIISTVAGDGTAGFGGDNGPAIAAQLNNPNDVTTDNAGNVLIADQNNHRIRRVAANGVITTIAGTGTAGFGGDGGAALQAQFSFPTSIAVAADGSVYVGDNSNARVRKLAPTGGPTNRNPAITTSFGNQTLTRGQVIDLPLAATDADNDPVTFSLVNAPQFASIINSDSPQRTATLRLAPTAAGTFNNVQIRADDGRGGTVLSSQFNIFVNEPPPGNQPPTATAAPLPSALEATSPTGAQVNLSGIGSDPDGDPLTFAWTDNGAVVATSADATVTLSVGSHNLVFSVTDDKGAKAMTPAQTVLVRDTTPPTIIGVPAPITVAATGASGATVNFTLPTATDIVDGSVMVTASRAPGSLFPVGATTVTFTATDGRGNTATAQFTVTITPFSGGGEGDGYRISTYAGNGDYGNSGNGGAATAATFRQINGLTLSVNGLLIVDGQSRVVRSVNAQGQINSFAGNGANANSGDNGPAIFASFGQPGGVAADAQGNVYISDTNFNRIRRVAPDGRIFHFAGATNGQGGSIGDNGQAATARLSRPTGLAVDAQGNVYVCDTGNQRVRVINVATGIITNVAGNGSAGYSGDGALATLANLNNPVGLAFDAQGNLYIADRNNHRIRRVDAATRLISTVAGNGDPGDGGNGGPATAAQLNNPNDVAVDNAGNLYIADQNNHRVRRVKTDGVIATIAGDGAQGFGGDGGAALQAQFNLPTTVAVAADGSVYVGDNSNLRVRRLTPNTPPPPVNKPPVLVATINHQTLTSGQTLELPLAATDEDNDPVSFTLVNAPSFAAIVNVNPAQRTATLRLAPTAIGTFNSVQVRADDGKGGVVTSAPFNITVNEPINTCLADVPANHWRGEYFNNRGLSGQPVLVRDDGSGALNLSLGTESPNANCGVPADNYSARWTRAVSFQGGLYRFSAFADDGVRLFIDGELKIDRWIDQGETRYDVDVPITSGVHTLRLEFYENTGAAVARLFWNALNHYPVVNNIANQAVTRGQTVEVEITANDSDNDPVTFSLNDAPSFVTLVNAEPAQRRARLRIAPPTGGGDQQFNLTVTADDGRGGRAVSNGFNVTVTDVPPPPANRPPTARANELPATITAPDSSGAVVRLDGSASTDPDGDPLSYSWTDQGTPIANTAIVEIKLPIGTHLLALTVNDGKGGVNSTAAQTVTINAPAPPPTGLAINSVTPTFGRRGTTLTVIVNGSGFTPGVQVTINGGGITTSTTYVSPTQLSVRVTISSNAFTTQRSITVLNSSTSQSTSLSNGFSVYP